jgi:hypothetical protein
VTLRCALAGVEAVADAATVDVDDDGDGDVEFDVTVSSRKNVKVRHSKEKWTAAVAAHLRRCCSRGLVSEVDVVVALRAMASRWQ